MNFKLLALVFIFSISAYSQKDCAQFRTGKFKNIENGVVNTYIERTETTQIEQSGNIVIKLDIEWISDCTYKLKFVEGNDAYWRSVPADMPAIELIVRIVGIEGNSYLQESKTTKDKDFIYRSNIEKIE